MAQSFASSINKSAPSSSIKTVREDFRDSQTTPRATVFAPSDYDIAAKSFLDSSRSSLSSDNDTTSNGTTKSATAPQLKTATSYQQLRRTVPYTSPSTEDLRKTPRERLQALLSSNSQPLPPTTAATSSGKPGMQSGGTSRNSPTSSNHESSRSQNTPSPTTTVGRITNHIPISSATAKQSMDRNNSLDSTMSSRSSNASAPTGPLPATAVQSTKTSLDFSNPTELDPATLIAASGSAEAAIMRLQKDRQALSIRNEQLWKLVEKQRAMILGLNKDLDKLVKERERHRQKTKEPQNTLDSLPVDPRSLHEKKKSDATVPPEIAHAATNEREDNRKAAPAPLLLRDNEQSHDSMRTPLSNAVSPSMISPGESRRKAPPKPLNIGHTPAVASTSSSIQTSQQHDSNVGETASPEVERGRRKTREDDDRERAASFAAQEEARSTSKKSSKSKSKSLPPVEDERVPVQIAAQPDLPAGLVNGIGLPSSPRAPLMGGLQSPMGQGGVGSIGNMLQQPSSFGNGPQIPSLYALKSPGLPMSPRPGDRPLNAPVPRGGPQMVASLLSPGPLSARGGILSPRPPRQPIPMPSDLASTFKPSQLSKTSLNNQQDSSGPGQFHKHQASLSPTATSFGDLGGIGPIYQGLTSKDHPGLLLSPKDLPAVIVQVYSSTLRPPRQHPLPNKGNEEDMIFTLAVHARSSGRQLWRLEKSLRNVYNLDHGLRRGSGFTARLPERNLFTSHVPARIDQRRAALDQYFSTALDCPLPEKSSLEICTFLSSDVIGPKVDSPTTDTHNTSVDRSRKEGFLSKKGKSFGGWKSRYFVLDGQDLQYYEAPGGPFHGTIRLHRAKVEQQLAGDQGEETEYRHALVISEQKRDDSSSVARHVLCAESDADRDDWIEALRTYTDGRQGKNSPIDESTTPQHSPTSSPRQTTLRRTKPVSPLSEAQEPSLQLQALGYDQVLQAEAPRMGSSPTDSNGSPVENQTEFGVPSVYSLQSPGMERPAISGPVAGGPIQNLTAWGNRQAPQKERRNLFGFKSKTPDDLSPSIHQTHFRNGPPSARLHSGRPVFGMHLSEAVQLFPPAGIDICLPAVVYRCIEYLEVRGAVNQVGIFRESGAVTAIENLQDRFNIDGDVNLLEGEPIENHAVATLLKRYLRDLPESILTRELHLDFLKVMETRNHADKVAAVNVLTHRLPEANFELLATLNRYLLEVVKHSSKNLMTEKNVAICVAQSINIPIPLFILFMTDYKSIFDSPPISNPPQIIKELDARSNTAAPSGGGGGGADELRSPRKQLFTDLATPLPNQQSFGSDTYQTHQQSYRPSQNHSSSISTTSSHQTYRPIAVPPPQIYDPGMSQGFGSLNAALAPSPSAISQASVSPTESMKESKKGKRESGIRGMNISSPISSTFAPNSLDGRHKASIDRARDTASTRDER